ncbi:MAG: hypothetical protein Rhims3KO_16840 [Hyphomicrobiales bacterium]
MTGFTSVLMSTAHLRRFVLAVAVLGFASMMMAQPTIANAQDRTLSLYNTHTHERLTVTYKRNGRFVQAGLDQLNRFLRDWRRDEVTRIDPDLFDVIWSVYREVGASEPIHVVSAYRSPATNNMLRRRSSGVAQNSQHTQGRAMDFFIPGISAADSRAAGLRLQEGGVGYYPRSNTPFVHLDTGSVRMWPRMTRSQLSRVFPDGRTIHVPADGQPMSGFEQAQRDLQRQGGGSSVTVASASVSSAQNDGDSDIVLPGEDGGGFLSALFGGGNAPEPAQAPAPAAATAPSAPTSALPAATEVASLESAPRERYAAPSPVLPPYGSVDGTFAAPSTIAGLNVPAPTPAPTLDELQLAALGRPQSDASIGAIAPASDGPILTAATSSPLIEAPAQVASAPAALPPITRVQQIAQNVPAPGQIAAIIEARFAEQRAVEDSLRGQVAQAFAPATATPAPAVQAAAVQASAAQSSQPSASQPPIAALAAALPPAEPDTVPFGVAPSLPEPIEVASAAASPRFVPPAPTAPPARAFDIAASSTSPVQQPSLASSLVAAAFAAQDEGRVATPAQSAIEDLTNATVADDQTIAANLLGSPAPVPPAPITGHLFPIADDLTPGLAKQSIRGSQHAALVAPTSTVSLSPTVAQPGGFLRASTFSPRSDSFGGLSLFGQ